MDNFYKYLPISVDDEDWGLQILHAGYHHCGPGCTYPDKEHPEHHLFGDNGRVLHEYSLLYIINGSGYYHSEKAGRLAIEAGSALIVFPNEQHHYYPDPGTGWTEYWIGFDGINVKRLAGKKIITPLNPIYAIGYSEIMIALFTQVIEAIKTEKPGYQPLVSGAVMYMLGQLHSSAKRQLLTSDEENIVNHARLLIRASIEAGGGPQDIAEKLQISYSRFRKLFKQYTGMAPIQYQLQLKLEKAKQELINTPKSVKEIAFELNFESSQYFSSHFKERTRLTPVEFRNQHKANHIADSL